MDSFAAALDALFNAPGSAAAVYRPADGTAPFPIRIIRGQPDELGPRNLVQATNVLDLRRSEVPNPVGGNGHSIRGDVVAIVDGAKLELIGTPMLDVEGLTWTIGAELWRD
jgi:hypothetical protein